MKVIDIYDARIALESTCAGLAAVRRTEFDLARLTHLLEERRTAADANAFGKLNNTWHDALRMAAHNTTILDLLTRLDPLLEVYRSRARPTADDQEVEVDEHEAVLAAIRDRDADTAQEAMREHLRRHRDRRIADLVAESS